MFNNENHSSHYLNSWKEKEEWVDIVLKEKGRERVEW